VQETVQADSQPGVASLVGGILEDAQKLVRQEIDLAHHEVAQAWDRAKIGAALFGSALAVFIVGGVLLGFMLVKLLNRYLLPNHELACFAIVGGVLLVLCGALVYCGIVQFNKVHVVLPQTVEALREDAHGVSAAVSEGQSSTTTTLKT
jgi:hypothetical protein